MLKKKMKIKNLLIPVILFIFGLSFLMPIVSSAGFDWVEYGNSYLPSHQAQFETPYSDFSQPVLNLTYSTSGQQQFSQPVQPIIDDFGDTDTNYVIMASGNFLRVLDNNLNLYTEYFVGMNPVGQMSAVEWNEGEGTKQVAGFWRENSTKLHFKVFELNHTTKIISEVFDYNFTHPATNGVSGVRCVGNTCYTILYDYNGTGYRWLHYKLNSTSQVANAIYPFYEQANAPREPPSMIDYNGNGVLDFLSFSSDVVSVYDNNGIVIANWSSFGSSYNIMSAKMFNADASPYWKVAILTTHGLDISVCGSGQFSCSKMWVYNIVDGSSIFNDKILGKGGSGDNVQAQGLAIRDYNGDGYDDIWAIAQSIGTNKQANMRIYKGDGTILYANDSLPTTYGSAFPNPSMTIARLNGVDNVFDVMRYANGGMSIWDITSNSVVYEQPLQVTTGQGSCVPADLNYDSFLDAVCVDSDSVELITPNITNYNPTISSVIYSPSISVQVNQTLTAIINASDVEGNGILYRGKCSNSEGWSVEDSSNVESCVYGAVGSYNMSVGVRDSFHATYNIFSQEINVTETGIICDNDNVCEAGETYNNCPNDCPINSTTTQTEGGIVIPTNLVNPDDINEGFLPQIYYGTLGFFSGVLSPMIVLVFVIFFTLIMLSIAVIIKKVAVKVSQMSS